MYTNPSNEAEGEMPVPRPASAVQARMVEKRPSLLVNLRQLWESIRLTVFVLGSALTVFLAARNSITWHLQRVWGASGDYWEHCWMKFYNYYEGDEFTLIFWGSFFLTVFVFWGFNIFFIIIDTTCLQHMFLKYKIQDEKNVPIDKKKLMKAVFWVLFNQIVVSPPVMYLWSHLVQWRGCGMIGSELPTFHWVLLEIVVYTLVEELMFYYSHRLFHHPRIYKYIHKKHHEWTAPVGIVSIYAHPIEHAVSNIIPPLAGPILMGSHIATAWLWFAIALVSTTISHCGYHLPFLPSPEAHDFHHLKFNNNFGVLGVLDRLHGTDTMFRASKQYQRHFMSLNMVPVTVQIPDDPKHGKVNAKPE